MAVAFVLRHCVLYTIYRHCVVLKVSVFKKKEKKHVSNNKHLFVARRKNFVVLIWALKRNLASSPATQTTEKNTKYNEIIDPLATNWIKTVTSFRLSFRLYGFRLKISAMCLPHESKNLEENGKSMDKKRVHIQWIVTFDCMLPSHSTESV